MRALIEIVHPADVLFFLNPIRRLLERGDTVSIASREKDVACALLDEFGLPHTPISRAGTGLFGLGRELLTRDARLARHVARNRPDVMAGLGGVSISHVGRVFGVPSVGFYAADTANLQTRLTWPFITHLYVPEPYAGPTPKGRTTRFPGVKELSYFHPDAFRPDRGAALAAGLDPDRPNFFVRTVAWRANHDLGKTGWSDSTLRALVAHLAERGAVHISSERDLPDDLTRHRYRGAKRAVHHLIAHCDLYVGESATMAHEAACLAVPAIYDGTDHPGTTRELARQGLLVALKQPGRDELMEEVERQSTPERRAAQRAARDAYLARCGNLSDTIVAALDRHARKRPNANRHGRGHEA